MFNRTKAQQKYEEAIQSCTTVTERISSLREKISKPTNLVHSRRHNDLRQLMAHPDS